MKMATPLHLYYIPNSLCAEHLLHTCGHTLRLRMSVAKGFATPESRFTFHTRILGEEFSVGLLHDKVNVIKSLDVYRGDSTEIQLPMTLATTAKAGPATESAFQDVMQEIMEKVNRDFALVFANADMHESPKDRIQKAMQIVASKVFDHMNHEEDRKRQRERLRSEKRMMEDRWFVDELTYWPDEMAARAVHAPAPPPRKYNDNEGTW